MTADGVALALHVLASIGLVGSSVRGSIAGRRLRRADTVGMASHHVDLLRRDARRSVPLAVTTTGTGAYLATVAGLWTTPWLVVSLVLFTTVGVAAAALVAPAADAVVEALADAPDRVVPPDVVLMTHAPAISVSTSLVVGLDLAILVLMIAEPALAGSLAVTLLGVLAGIALGARERRLPAIAAA